MKHDVPTGGEIVQLARYQKDMRFPVLNEVRAYWEALRDGRPMPLRSDVDPRGIEQALEYAFILERIAPGIARFRLAGMHLNDLMGMEVRGMPLTAFFTPGARADITETLEGVFSAPQIAEISLSGERGIGKPQLDAKLLLLPLKSDLGDVSRALGCLVSLGQTGRAPRRFDVVETRRTALGAAVSGAAGAAVGAAPQACATSRSADTADAGVQRGGAAAGRGFAEPRATFANPAPGQASEHPAERSYLRLVRTDG